jgi:hypothetical protein
MQKAATRDTVSARAPNQRKWVLRNNSSGANDAHRLKFANLHTAAILLL